MRKIIVLLGILCLCLSIIDAQINQGKPGYLMIFNDEFSGQMLDTTKWFPTYGKNYYRDLSHIQDRDEYYKPENVSFEDGKLKIVVKDEDFFGYTYNWGSNDSLKDVGWRDSLVNIRYNKCMDSLGFPCSDFSGNQKDLTLLEVGIPGIFSNKQEWHHSSGQINTYQTFKNGVYEINAKMSNGRGQVPAFWLFNHAGLSDEIDFFEGKGDRENVFQFTIHKHNSGQKSHNVQFIPLTGGYIDLSADFHTYTGLWKEKDVSIYFDGKHKHTHYHRFSPRMYLILGVCLFDLGGWPIDDTKLPSEFEVDYIRIYYEYNDNPLTLSSWSNQENENTVFVHKSIEIKNPSPDKPFILEGRPNAWTKYGAILHCYAKDNIVISGEFEAQPGSELKLEIIEQMPDDSWRAIH